MELWKWMGLVVVVISCGGTETFVVGSQSEGEVWAVLLAGSVGWFNYRHQADVCHAYQILHKHGVPDDHIIVMIHDDIVNHSMNLWPGKLFNRPGGPDVYQGVPKDYTGEDLTPSNFIKVLTGDADGVKGVGSGKVLGSGPNDRVFLYMSDHGGPGIFGFPKTFLHARNFTQTLVNMHHNKQFKEMTVYMESCYSGSMVKDLPDDISIYAVTAANATQNSQACYWMEKMQTFLGDVFSVKWMEDTDRENVTEETLEAQYLLVRKETITSNVTQWGQKSLDSLTLGNFVGDTGEANGDIYGPFDVYHDACLNSSVSSPDVPLIILQHKVDTTEILADKTYWKQQLDQMHQNRSKVEATMLEITSKVTKDKKVTINIIADHHHQINNRLCYERSADFFSRACYNFGENPYAFRVAYVMVNLCEHGYTAEEFISAAKTSCRHPPVTGIN